MKYFIKTFGCQMNFSDSERMDSFLEEKGLKKVSRPEDADLIVINTCAVRQTAEDRVWGNLKNYKEKNPESKVVLTGCMAHRDDVQKNLAKYVDVFASVEEVWNKLSEAVASSETGFPENYLNIPPKYKHDDFAFVPIMTGCNNFCSYCVVPYARGREWSRSPKDIFEEIEKLNKKGVKEVLLLGQNVNSYRYGILNLESSILNKINSKFEIRNSKFKCRQHEELGFPQLLFFLAKTFPAINWRFLTSHPKDLSDELIEVIAGNENIPNEIHLPLQSGSDKVLRDMNRPYTQKHYLNLIKKIKNIIPGATITTDVIVGFPTETEEDFQETIKVFREARFDDAFINKYSPRPQTAAQKLGNPISWEEKKRREKELRKELPQK
ncbi:MAG: MiaB/RimO family radical SAM methylthiotransferase [Candidatus Moranbacteria bacterium]|nr:MiaB/RimO family radical SAM methylthiotransferase [Candidatus Moranbacteria bacterium]